METFGEIRAWSFVHEVGEKDDDDAMPYQHTHVFVWWKKALAIRNCRRWDMGPADAIIHPDFVPVNDIKHAKHICLKYHLGHKTKACGKKYFKAPVYLSQEGVDEWKFNNLMWDCVASAPSLKEAAQFVGAHAKSLSDCRMIRGEGLKRKHTEMQEGVNPDKFIKLPERIVWDKKDRSLLIIGEPRLGKTQWALSQFKFPFKIDDIEDLREAPPNCDGYVFDDIDFKPYKMATQKKITDARCESSIRARNTNVRKLLLPAIFLHNELPFNLNGLDGAAVKERLVQWYVKPEDLSPIGKFYCE